MLTLAHTLTLTGRSPHGHGGVQQGAARGLVQHKTAAALRFACGSGRLIGQAPGAFQACRATYGVR